MRYSAYARFLVGTVLLLSLVGAVEGFGQSRLIRAEPAVSVTIGQPDGQDDVVGNGDDFATTVLGDPWDMSEATDIMAIHHIPNATISNGELSLTTESDRTKIPILFAGFEGRVDVGKIGMNYPIDSTTYRWLSLRMYHPAGNFKIRWTYGRYGDPDRAWVETTNYTAVSGWHTYVIDLSAAEIAYTNGGATGWNGMVPQISIISGAPAGSVVHFDWVRLTADNPADNGLEITWSDLSSSPTALTFYLDSDTAGCDGPMIHEERMPSTSGSFSWQQAAEGMASPANAAPGSYYVCARADGALAGYSTGQLTVNQSPVLRFTRPSFTSGDDYATQAGNAWDMAERADVSDVVNGSYTTENGILKVTVPAEYTDPQVYLHVPQPIDSSHYQYLTYRLWFDYPYGKVSVGQHARVFWGYDSNVETMSDLVYVYPGWQTYTIDLRSLTREFGSAWGTTDWDIFRIDPIANHTGEMVSFYVDNVLLTADEEADRYIDVLWDLVDPDTSLTTMTLYYDTDQTGMDGTHIATLPLNEGEQTGSGGGTSPLAHPAIGVTETLSETVYLPLVLRDYVSPCTGACYTWSTAGVEAGTYYLYGCVEDGYNRFCRYSEAPVWVRH